MYFVMPKGFRTDINVNLGKIGPEQRQEILDEISGRSGFLPKGVLEEDMDQTVIDFIKSDDRVKLSVEGKKVPVIFLSIQRWAEFSKTWEFTDQYKDIEMPFITIIRKPDIQQGQNQAGLWNIPGDRTYTYMKVPTWDGTRKGIDLYKIPQPTSVDLTYEVRLFTNKMKDLNRFNGKIQRAFQSRQCYIKVNGHPMPLHLESIGDESNIEDFENRRFYVQMFEMKLLGYILDEEDFEVIPTANRTILALEVEENLLKPTNIIHHKEKNGNVVTYNFDFKPSATPQFTFTQQYDVSFTQLTGIKNISRIIIRVNGTGMFDGTILSTPLVFNQNDSIEIRIYKDNQVNGEFILIGNTI